jgi:hypothetical protein
MDPTHLHIPPGHGPSWLNGLRSPASKDEALAFAEAHGAPPDALEFLEALPAAVFSSEDGLRHVLTTMDREHLPRHGDIRETPAAEDGTSG